MKKVFWVLILVLFSVTVWAEDLGELAKKEKARREELKKQGKKAQVLTNEDVKSIKSSLGIESSGVTSDTSGQAQGEPSAALEEAISDSSSQLDALKKQKGELIREIQDTSDSIQQSGVHSRNLGEQYKQKRLAEEELKKVEEQIETLENKSGKTPQNQAEHESEKEQEEN